MKHRYTFWLYSLARSQIHRIFAIRSLVPLFFMKPACTAETSLSLTFSILPCNTFRRILLAWDTVLLFCYLHIPAHPLPSVLECIPTLSSPAAILLSSKSFNKALSASVFLLPYLPSTAQQIYHPTLVTCCLLIHESLFLPRQLQL